MNKHFDLKDYYIKIKSELLTLRPGAPSNPFSPGLPASPYNE